VAFRSFALTLSLFAGAALVLGGASYYFLKENRAYALCFALAAIVEAVAAGIFLGGKRAIVMALATGVARAQLGGSALRLCFDYLLKVSPEDTFGERGTKVAMAVERLPLAQAERRLARAVQELTDCSVAGNKLTSWFWQALNRRLVRLVQAFTLANFREQCAKEGGVDLVKARAELGPIIDHLLVRKLKKGLNLWVAAFLVALALVVSAQIYFVHTRLHAP
jgi:hypothetical protein